jgi:Fe-S-cluster containining protein
MDQNMERILEQLPDMARDKREENKRYFSRLKKKPRKRLDLLVHELHNEEFSRTDCLSCGNCCKTTSPIFTDKDISRISRFLKMKELDFIGQYLRRDEDDFMVLQQSPCPFLGEDNACFIYESRPKACSEYPHTDRKKFLQIAQLTVKNTEICPAAFNIVENLKKRLPV